MHSAGHSQVLEGQSGSMEEFQDWQAISESRYSDHFWYWETRQSCRDQSWRQRGLFSNAELWSGFVSTWKRQTLWLFVKHPNVSMHSSAVTLWPLTGGNNLVTVARGSQLHAGYLQWIHQTIEQTGELTLQVVSRDQLSWNKEWGDLHHKCGVRQTPPAPNSVWTEDRKTFWHKHSPIWSKTWEQNIPEVPSLDPSTSTAVPHHSDLKTETDLTSEKDL